MSLVDATVAQRQRSVKNDIVQPPISYMGLVAVLVLLIVMLSYRLIFGDGSVQDYWRLQKEAVAQHNELNRLEDRNKALRAEVDDLRKGLAAIEERARSDLGMIREGEIYYQFIEKKLKPD